MTTSAASAGAKSEPLTFLEQIDAFLRACAAAAIAGAVAGMLAGGIGGRIAMRVTALTAGDADQGRLTDAEEVVGVISLDGTLGLIIFVGLSTGFFGGMLYAGARPWFAGLGRWRGLAFGVLLLASLGWTAIERDNFDFHRFGYASLNLAMFAAIFISFGLIIVPLFEFVRRLLPRVRVSLAGGVGIAARAGGVFALAMGMPLAITLGFEAGGGLGFVPAYLLVVPPLAAAWLGSRISAFRSIDDLANVGRERATAVAVFALPVIAGTVGTVRAVVHHLTTSG